MRRPHLTPIAGLALAVAMTTACSADEASVTTRSPAPATSATEEPTPTTEPAAPTAEAPTAEAPTSVESAKPTTAPSPEDPSPEAEPEEEPAPEETTEEPEAELGTRQNPGVVGEGEATFSFDDDEVAISLDEPTWDANAIVAEENQFNDPPADGNVHVLLPVTVGYAGPDSIVPWLEVDVVYLADNGRSYETTFGSIPNDLSDINDLYDGGEATGNLLFELPADQVETGLWGVSRGFGDNTLWFGGSDD